MILRLPGVGVDEAAARAVEEAALGDDRELVAALAADGELGALLGGRARAGDEAAAFEAQPELIEHHAHERHGVVRDAVPDV
ncbi:MAG: hypothetical protein U0359_31570 [Byssovorax sp.]